MKKKMNDDQFLAGLRGNLVIAALFAVLFAAVILLFVNFIYSSTQAKYDKEYITHAGELRVLSQRMAKDSVEAAVGKAQAFALLRAARNDFESRWGFLQQGDSATQLPSAPSAVAAEMDAVAQSWASLRSDASVIVDSEQIVVALHETAAVLATTIPQLQDKYEEVTDLLLRNAAPAVQVSVAQRQVLLAERILGSVNTVLDGDEESVLAADALARVLTALREGNQRLQASPMLSTEALNRLAETDELFAVVARSVETILQASPELFKVREAANSMFSDSQTLLDRVSVLAASFESRADGRRLNTLFGYILGAVALAAIVLIGLISMRETRMRLAETAATNDRNQAAILRLLDEIGDLADGDLTVEATVTEDFTGAIADSINYTIDQLRELVGTINGTAVQVASAAQETQSTATHLAEAAEHQAREIAGASAAINEMAGSIDQVSANAAESAAVAERSVAIANKGSEVVHNTITGMDSIREQIQDTSKRIKRLGESSQEIGDIVSLINDIADQTNILSLNAAIQASMAGDAGRGFAVVADEVQRLAERSSSATKQIEALVKTIQADTNEAVISMEQTTTGVVRGAQLAQDAGVSLEEIEQVSKSLAELIQNISNAARQQAASAGHISSTMNVIQEITSQTSAGTTTTAQSIGTLAKMANEMQQSVSGFNLPSDSSQNV